MRCDSLSWLQTIFSCPKCARESEGTLLLFIFFNSFIGYDSNNTLTTIQYTIKIENTRYSKKIHRERKADKTGTNGTQGPERGTAREMKKETKS